MLRRCALALLAVAFVPLFAGAEDNPAKLETRKITVPGTTATYEFIKIPGGTVTVDGKPVEVKPIWVGKTEVPWDCFEIWAMALDLPLNQRKLATKDGGSRPTAPYGAADRGYGHEGYPALGMNYEGTLDYCKWLEERLKVKFRLPTEAEFIYAAQAGTGKDPTPAELDKIAWFKSNSDSKTHPIGEKAPNAFGLHDMYGNVAEWVMKPDPASDEKFIKGGSFKDTAKNVNSKSRNIWNADWQARDAQDPKSKWWMSDADFAGFRLVADQDPAPAGK
jgi:formylglycine-generating enzyme required for sulfatase activity